MPSAAEILEGLTHIANRFLALAVLWHVAIGAAIAAVASGRWRPSRRAGALLLVLLPLSVGAMAWIAGNPFNGTVFTVLAVALLAIAARLPSEPAGRVPTWAFVLGGAALAYAWVYPHFLETHPAWMYLVAAPVGIVPCPSLSAILGFGLLAGGFQSKAWSVVAGAAGLFYGLFGMFRLGVWLDAGLLLAAVAMLSLAFAPRRGTGHVHADAGT